MAAILGITPWPVLSVLICFVVVVAVLFSPATRLVGNPDRNECDRTRPAHSRALRRAAEMRLAARNREVLLAAGREAKERIVEREFERVNETVRKDLANYPTLHRALSESIMRIEENHQNAVDVPPEAPGWVRAVEAVAKIDARNGAADVLADIHKSLIKAHKEAMEAIARQAVKRHALLRKMMPELARHAADAGPRQKSSTACWPARSRSTVTCRSTRTS